MRKGIILAGTRDPVHYNTDRFNGLPAAAWFQTTISNCSNNYGPRQFAEKLIPLMLVQLLAGKPLPVYGDGRDIRDWLHVEHHCRGIEAVLARGQAGEVYNFGGRSECENIELVHMLCGLVDEHLRSNPADRARYPQSAAAAG